MTLAVILLLESNVMGLGTWHEASNQRKRGIALAAYV